MRRRHLLLLPAVACCGSCGALADLAAQGESGGAGALHLELISGLRARGMHHAAIAHLDEYERRHGATAATRLMRGQSLLEIGEDEAALPILRGITRGPEQGSALSGIGAIHARAGRWNEAEAAFAAANRLEPTNARHLNNLGYALLRLGRSREAEIRLRTAAELDPDSPEIRNNIALLMLATGRRVEGERLLAQVPSRAARGEIRRVAETIRTGVPGEDR